MLKSIIKDLLLSKYKWLGFGKYKIYNLKFNNEYKNYFKWNKLSIWKNVFCDVFIFLYLLVWILWNWYF